MNFSDKLAIYIKDWAVARGWPMTLARGWPAVVARGRPTTVVWGRQGWRGQRRWSARVKRGIGWCTGPRHCGAGMVGHREGVGTSVVGQLGRWQGAVALDGDNVWQGWLRGTWPMGCEAQGCRGKGHPGQQQCGGVIGRVWGGQLWAVFCHLMVASMCHKRRSMTRH